jgi:ABC-type nickel/cobalt efflux system permease component RcnA
MDMLVAGFLLGLRHALDPDHLAAVASISADTQSAKRRVIQGAVWGLGHTVTLLVIGGIAILLGTLVPENLAVWLEAAVGVMLVLLGIDVLRRIRMERIHVHTHSHGEHPDHVHFHTHRKSPSHDHEHPDAFPVRMFLVGLMHGLAGSAGLVLLAVSATSQPLLGLAYVILFGVGSILGMALLSVILVVPLRVLPQKIYRQVRIGLGITTVVIGILILREFVMTIA